MTRATQKKSRSPRPTITLTALRDHLAQLLVQPPHLYQPGDPMEKARCARVLLRAIELIDRNARAETSATLEPSQRPVVWLPPRIPTPEEWNEAIFREKAERAAAAAKPPGEAATDEPVINAALDLDAAQCHDHSAPPEPPRTGRMHNGEWQWN